MAIEEFIRLEPTELRSLLDTIEYEVFRGARDETRRLGRYIAPEEYQPDVMRLLKGTKGLPEAAEQVDKYISVLRDETDDLKSTVTDLEDELDEADKQIEYWKNKYNEKASDELIRLRAENAQHHDTIDSLHLQIEALDKQYEPLDEQGRETNHALRSIKADIDNAIDSFQHMHDVLSKIKPYKRPGGKCTCERDTINNGFCNCNA